MNLFGRMIDVSLLNRPIFRIEIEIKTNKSLMVSCLFSYSYLFFLKGHIIEKNNLLCLEKKQKKAKAAIQAS